MLATLRANPEPAGARELDALEAVEDEPMRIWAVVALAELDILNGHPEVALARIRWASDEPIRDFTGMGLSGLTGKRGETTAGQPTRDFLKATLLYAPLAWAHLARGDSQACAGALAEGRERANGRHHRMALVDIARIEALLALRERRLADALRAVTESLAICIAGPLPYHEAKARWVAGQIHAALGAADEARVEYTHALTICARLGERPYRSHVQTSLDALSPGAGA